MKLVFATNNQHKCEEFGYFLRPFGEAIEMLTLRDLPGHPPLIEDRATFEENALAKASVIAPFAGQWTLADDSGLEVDRLGGGPGVYSARYASPTGATNDRANNEKLLRELSGVPPEKRTARYQCVLALVEPTLKRHFTFSGSCEGRILTEPRGKGGFGYDPLFFLPEVQATMAEIPFATKNSLSHRARAFQKLLAFLPKLLSKRP